MDYEKKYNEALDAIKKLQEANPSDEGIQNWVNDNFPKLKESKGERIREQIISFIEEYGNPAHCEWQKDWIAWLEKQGNEPQGKSALEAVNEEKVDNQNCVKTDDKVEPKFHEGEWVVFKNKHQSIYQVEKIENGYYILRHTHGGSFRVCVFHDESLRLWTLRDAKDGDVLASDNGVIILVKVSRDSPFGYRLSYHCAILYDGTFEPREFHVNPEKFFPATKEQRDTLFAKMKDAGYIFDFMKKELKEIEQKPAWSEEDEKLYQDALDAFEALGNDLDPLEDWGRLYDWLKSIKQRMGV